MLIDPPLDRPLDHPLDRWHVDSHFATKTHRPDIQSLVKFPFHHWPIEVIESGRETRGHAAPGE